MENQICGQPVRPAQNGRDRGLCTRLINSSTGLHRGQHGNETCAVCGLENKMPHQQICHSCRHKRNIADGRRRGIEQRIPKMIRIAVCIQCQREFQTFNSLQKYCGHKCQGEATKRKHIIKELSRNPSAVRERSRVRPDKTARKLERRRFILEYKSTHPCIDCGESDPVCLQFDHRDPSQKEGEAHEWLKWKMERILAEMAKCDIRCANCHLKRHARERELLFQGVTPMNHVKGTEGRELMEKTEQNREIMGGSHSHRESLCCGHDTRKSIAKDEENRGTLGKMVEAH